MKFKKTIVATLVLATHLCACSMKTVQKVSTVFDIGAHCINAGNYRLTEWGSIPPDYEEYLGVYISSYRYVLKHDGTISFDATYLFERVSGEGRYEEHEVGVYQASELGPNKKIDIALPSRRCVLTWEPNPREPTGNLVGRLWEQRTMVFPFKESSISRGDSVDVYIVLVSENLSPWPL